MTRNNTSNRKDGFGLIEIVIAAGIITFALTGLSAVSSLSFRLIKEQTRELQASFLLQEGVEAMKTMRDRSWSAAIQPLIAETDYALAFNAGAWKAVGSSGNPLIDGAFGRTFRISEVYRDANDDIAPAGTLDTGTKKITIVVAWSSRGATTSREFSSYLTNLFSN